MEIEFPEFVLLLLVAVGLLAFGPFPQSARERLDRMAAVTAAAHCAVPNEASHYFGSPAPPGACTLH